MALLAFVPPNTISSDYSWTLSANSQEKSGLLRPTPKNIALTGQCPTAPTHDETIRGDNWSVSFSGSQLTITDTGDVPVISTTLPQSCDLIISYTAPAQFGRSPHLSIETSSQGIATREEATPNVPWRLTSFESTSETAPKITQLTLTTHPWGITVTPWRVVGLILSLLAVSALVFLPHRGPRNVFALSSSRIREGELTLPESAAQDKTDWKQNGGIHALVLLALVAGMMVFPSYWDDGYVLDRISQSLSTGVFTNPYGQEDIWLPLGLWLERLMALQVFLGASFEQMRLLFAFLLWGAWLALSGFLSRLNYISHPLERLITAATFVAFSLAFLVTIRAEPIVAVLAALFFIGFVGFVHTHRRSYLMISGLAAVMAVTAHQSGFALLFPAVLLIGIAVWRASRGIISNRDLAYPIIAAILLGATLAFLDYDVFTLFGETKLAASYEMNSRSESARWRGLAREPGWKWWPLLVAAIALLGASARFFSMNSRERLLLLAVATTPLGLFFTASKWTHHFGGLAVPGVLAVVLAIMGLRKVFKDRFGTVVALVVLTVVGGYLTFVQINRHGIWVWEYPVKKFSNGVVGELLPGVDFGTLWWLLPWLPLFFVALAASATLMSRNGPRHLAAISYVLATIFIVFPSANHYGMLVVDSAASSSWTPLQQRLKVLAGQSTCGMLDDISPLVSATPDGATISIPSGVGPFDLPVYTVHGDSSINFSPSADSPRALSLWVTAAADPVAIDASISATGGATSPVVEKLELTPTYWRRVEIPAGKSWADLVIAAHDPGHGSQFYITHLAATTDSFSADVLSGTTILAGPPRSTYIPCASEPKNNGGTWGTIDYLVFSDRHPGYRLDLVSGDKVEVGDSFGKRNSYIRLWKVIDPISQGLHEAGDR